MKSNAGLAVLSLVLGAVFVSTALSQSEPEKLPRAAELSEAGVPGSAPAPATAHGQAGRRSAAPDAAPERADLSPEDRARVAAVTASTQDFSVAEPYEVMQGGAGTVSKLVNRDIFSHPAANLDFEGRQAFMVGNGLFRKDWVSSPSSTQAS